MKTENFRVTSTQRGYTYSYYYRASTDNKPTVLFLHGFPSTHRDWSLQITYFEEKGYGIIAPDLLGYGKTSAPEDPSEYRLRALGNDIVDILNDLKITKVIGVGHDWGCFLLSRLVDNHSSYFIGAAFLAVGYIPPQPDYDYKTEMQAQIQHFGYSLFGYWEFFCADDAVSLTEKNLDSFYSLAFPDDPLIWKTDMAPRVKTREWIEQNKQRPRAGFWTAETMKEHKAALMQKGLRGPYNWYRARYMGLNNADEQRTVLSGAPSISVPAFFGGATKDYICLVGAAKTRMSKLCSKLTIKEFNTSHWIMHEAPHELNEALEGFFVTIG